jgi:hypothetical protein
LAYYFGPVVYEEFVNTKIEVERLDFLGVRRGSLLGEGSKRPIRLS